MYEFIARNGLIAQNDSIITGSLTVTGTITATTLVAQTITSSTSWITGSTKFGSTTSNTHQFTGSIYQSGSEAIFAGSVGIGTTNPDVFSRSYNGRILGISSLGQSAIELNGAAGSAAYIDMGVNGTRYLGLYSDASSSDISTIGAYPLTFGTNSTTRMVITSGGNVGIGTTSPAVKLSVVGSISITSGNDLTWGNVAYGAGVPTIAAVSGSSAYIAFYPAGSTSGEKVKINSDGNVGIGSTSPTYKLDVSGSIGMNGRLFAFNSATYTQITDPAGGIKLYLGASGDPGNYYDNTSHNFRSSGGGTNYVTINSAGSVGIGTTNPSFLLNIYGSNAATVYQTSGTGTGGGNGFYVGHTSNISYLWNYNNFPLVLATNNTERMRIDSGGNVGIGTTSPGAKLHIKRTSSEVPVQIDSTNATSASYTQYLVNGSGGWEHGMAGSGDTYKYFFSYGSFGSTNAKLTFQNDGNVGIGTTSPTLARLQVQGNVSASSFTGSLLGTASTATSATSATYVNGTSGQLLSKDDRIIEPNSISSGYMQFGFTSWANNNSSPYADYIHLRSYTDSSGGTDNLLMFLKSGFGIRTWQQTFNSASAYSSYRDVALISGSNTGYVPFWTQTNQLLDSALYYNGTNVGIGTTSPSEKLHIYGTGNQLLKVENSGTYLVYFGLSSNEGYIGSTNATPLNIITNNSSRIYIKTDGNVGIGTTSPSFRLSVQGIAQARGGVYVTQASPTNTLILDADDTALHKIFTNSTVALSLGTNSSTSQIYLQSGGNVGIGTTSPGQKLHVSGNIYSTGYIQGGLAVITDFNGYAMFGSNSSSTPLAFGLDAGAYNMVINTSGNVGIGTTSPNAKFQVADGGADWATSGTIGIGLGSIHLSPSNNTANYGNAITFGARDSSPYSAAHAGIYVRSGGGFGTTMAFGTTDNYSVGTKVSMYIDASGIVTIPRNNLLITSGNVGIGTTSPSGKLQVLDAGGQITSYDANGYTRFTAYNGSAQIGLFRSGSTAGGVYIGGDGNAFQIYTSNFGSTLLTILQSGGNVGIGTTSPSDKLDVSGNISIGSTNKLYNGSAADSAGLFFSSNVTNISGYSGISFRASTTNIASQTVRMFIQNDGNVGIGTTSPTQLLHILGTNAANNGITIQNTNSSGNSQVRFLNTSGTERAAITYVNSADAVYHYTAGGGNVLNLVSANVGIGTTSPSAILHTAGNTKLGGGTLQVSTDQTFVTNYSYTFRDAVGINNPNSLSAATATTVMSIGSMTNGVSLITTGNVGIGTTSPSQKLDVSGNIQGTTGLILTGNAAKVSTTYAGVTTTNFFTDANGGVISVDGSNKISLRQGGVSGTDAITIAGSGNVGIGTTSPNFKLQVDHATTSQYVASFRNTADNLQLKIGTTTGALLNIQGSTISANSAYNISLQADGGNVGIGTTTPSGLLTVAQSVNSGTANVLYLSNPSQTGTTAAAINFINADSTIKSSIIAAVYNNDYMTFNVGSNTERVRINANGNVGIGTTSPAYELDVAGSIRLSSRQFINGNTTLAYKVKYDQFNLGNGAVTTDSDAADGNAIYMNSASGSTFFFGPYTSMTPGEYIASFRMKVASNSSTSNLGQIDVMGTNTTGSLVVIAPSMFETSNRYQYIDIPFTVNGSSANIEFRGIGFSSGITTTYLDHVIVRPLSKNYTQLIPSGKNYNIYYTGVGTPRLTIDTSGNVGIGTSSPSTRLHVVGSGLTEIRNTQGSSSFKIVTGTGFSTIGTLTNDPLVIVTNDTERMRILSGGNVGIGTTSPAYLLDVSGTIRATGDVIAYSDARVKDNVETITDALTKVTSLRGVSYTRNDSEDKSTKVGVIAQEVLEVLPEVVQQDDNGNYSVAYGNIVGVLIEAIKELKAEINELKNNK